MCAKFWSCLTQVSLSETRRILVWLALWTYKGFEFGSRRDAVASVLPCETDGETGGGVNATTFAYEIGIAKTKRRWNGDSIWIWEIESSNRWITRTMSSKKKKTLHNIYFFYHIIFFFHIIQHTFNFYTTRVLFNKIQHTILLNNNFSYIHIK